MSWEVGPVTVLYFDTVLPFHLPVVRDPDTILCKLARIIECLIIREIYA
jgi:hypothetical protein